MQIVELGRRYEIKESKMKFFSTPYDAEWKKRSRRLKAEGYSRLDRMIAYADFWFVPFNATQEQRARRIREVGLGIGGIIGLVILIVLALIFL